MDNLNEQLFDLTNNPAGKDIFVSMILNQINNLGYNYKSIEMKWHTRATIKLNLIDICNKSNIWGLIIDSDIIYLYDCKNHFEIHINPSQLMRKAKLEKIFTENE